MSEQTDVVSILDAFTYEDYPEGCDDKPRMGDYVYAACQMPPDWGEVDLYGQIVTYSDDRFGVKPTPALLDGNGDYNSLLDILIDGFIFSRITKEEYIKATGGAS